MTSPDDELFDRAPCGLLVTDAEDIVVRVNTTFLEWTGFAEADVLGGAFAGLLDPGSQAFYATQYQDELWSRPEVREIALMVVTAAKTLMPVLVNARATRRGDEIRGARIAVFGTSSRQDFEREMLRAKRAAEASEAGVRMLQQAATRFLAAHSTDDLAERLALTVREAFDASDTTVAVYAADGASFRVIHGDHLGGVLAAVRGSRTDGRQALSADQLIVVHDLEEAYERSESLGDALRAVRAGAYIGVPISDGDRVMGAFGALFGRPRSFDDTARELYRALARQTGLALSRILVQQELEALAARDPLTGVANRLTIDQVVADAIETGRHDGAPAALIFLDLDGFKGVNDRFGHRVGDQVLRSTADRIVGAVRSTDRVGRFGGDEFLVVCPHTDRQVAGNIAERVAAAVRAPIPNTPDDARVTASIGVAVFDPADDRPVTADSLTGAADAAMYASKRSGSGQVTVTGA